MNSPILDGFTKSCGSAKMGSAGVLRRRLIGLFLGFVLSGVPGAMGQTTAGVGNGTNTATVYKTMSLEQLMNQDVTSVSKEPERYGQAPAAIQVVTSDDIHRYGASSLPEALRLADNLDVAQVNAAGWDISARGFNSSESDKLLVLMDGRTIYTPLFAGVIWSMQDYLMEDIDRIEVISGPGGTLWGANAMNGVINITSKSAKDTQGLYVESGGGSWLEDFAGVRYGGVLTSNIYYRVYGKYFDRGSEVFADGTSADDRWRRGQGGFRIDTDNPGPDQFTVQGDIYGNNTHIRPTGETAGTANGHANGGNVLGRWTRTFADNSDMSLQVYYDRAHLAAPFPSNAPPFALPAGTLYDSLDTVDLDFQDRFPLGTWNRIIWGLGYRYTHDDEQPAPLVAFLPTELDRDLFSGFLQDEIKLHDDVFLTVGSKLEHNDYTGFECEPSARLQWNATDKQMLWGAVSRAVRTPSRFDRDLAEPDPAYGTFLAGNSSFQSETLIAYEAGYRAQLGKKVSGSISIFYNDYDNLRGLYLTDGTSLPYIFVNSLTGDTYGLEVSADFQVLDWWHLHAGYDWLQEDIHVKTGQHDVYQALNETADPANQVFLRSSMDLPGRVELSASARWIDTVHNNNFATAGTVPDYFELDARLGWHATKNLEVSVVGQNLLQDHHAEAGFPGPLQEQVVRSVYGEVSFRW